MSLCAGLPPVKKLDKEQGVEDTNDEDSMRALDISNQEDFNKSRTSSLSRCKFNVL